MAAVLAEGPGGLPGNLELDELCEHINHQHRVKTQLLSTSRNCEHACIIDFLRQLCMQCYDTLQ